MENSVQNADDTETIAENYADEKCVGTMSEVIDVIHEDPTWIVKFRTHTFSEEFVHRIEITESVGNVIAHDRNTAPA